MPCCGRWQFRQLFKHVIFPGLLILGVNIMWVTTRLAGPRLPTPTGINAIQQAVQTLVSSGVIALGVKVAAGLKWSHARRQKGITLRGLLETPETSLGKVFKSMRRAGSCSEVLLYAFILAASMYHFLLNINPDTVVFVPGYKQYTTGNASIPDFRYNELLASDWLAEDSLAQPGNMNDFIEDNILKYVPDSEKTWWKYSPALLSWANFSFPNSAEHLASDSPVVLEVAQPAVLLFAQNLDAILQYTFDPSTDWEFYYANLSSDGNYYVQAGLVYLTITGESYVGTEVNLCITHMPTNQTDPDAAYACVSMGYIMVDAQVVYDVNHRIIDSSLTAVNTDFALMHIGSVNSDDFAEYFEDLPGGWNVSLGLNLAASTLWNRIVSYSIPLTVESTEGLYSPATPKSIMGVALYTGLASLTVLILCTLLLCFDPEEATQSTGLLALSRWPAELTTGTYGVREKLTESGKRRVYLEQHPSGQWTFAPEKGAMLSSSPSMLSPSSSLDSSKPQPMMEYMPDLLDSQILSKRRKSHRHSTPSPPVTPGFQVPRPSHRSRPSYKSRPSYQSRPSYKSRPSSASRPEVEMPSPPAVYSPGFRPHLSRTTSQGQSYFPSPPLASPPPDASSPPFSTETRPQGAVWMGSRPAYLSYSGRRSDSP